MFLFRPAPVRIRKAIQAREPEWRLIHRLADAKLAPLQQEFLEAVEHTKGKVAVAELADALQRRDLARAQAIAGGQEFGMDPVKVQNILQGLVAAVGTSVAARMERQFKTSFAFDLLNPRTVSFITQHTGELIKQVGNDTIAAVKDIVQRAFERGGHPYEQAKMIRNHIGLLDRQSRAVENLRNRQLAAGISQERADWQAERYASRLLRDRAELIARTETINAASEGQRETWREMADAGVLDPDEWEREWIATPGDRTCSACLEMDGKRAPIFGTYENGSDGPTLHPACVPGSTYIAARGSIEAASKRWFEGELVVIQTAAGRELSCTPNHPILTPCGWISAGGLDVGSGVISHHFGQRPLGVSDENQGLPARIEDVTEAFLRSPNVATIPVPVSSPDFHGDGSGSKVAVIGTYGKLRDRVDPAISQHLGEGLLYRRVIATFPLFGLGVCYSLLQRCMAASGGIVGRSHLSLPLLRCHLRPLERLRLALVAWLDASSKELVLYSTTAGPEVLGNDILGKARRVQLDDLTSRKTESIISGPKGDACILEKATHSRVPDSEFSSQWFSPFAAKVFLDHIVGIRRIPFAGHVYNLQTESGMYAANGIITHNCRCSEGLRRRE